VTTKSQPRSHKPLALPSRTDTRGQSRGRAYGGPADGQCWRRAAPGVALCQVPPFSPRGVPGSWDGPVPGALDSSSGASSAGCSSAGEATLPRGVPAGSGAFGASSSTGPVAPPTRAPPRSLPVSSTSALVRRPSYGGMARSLSSVVATCTPSIQLRDASTGLLLKLQIPSAGLVTHLPDPGGSPRCRSPRRIRPQGDPPARRLARHCRCRVNRERRADLAAPLPGVHRVCSSSPVLSRSALGAGTRSRNVTPSTARSPNIFALRRSASRKFTEKSTNVGPRGPVDRPESDMTKLCP